MKLIVSLLLLLSTRLLVFSQSTDSVASPSNKYKIVTGKATFYSACLDGTKTSTGEIFNNKNMTAASNSFKMHTWVMVKNLSNNKTVVVRINDRMHPRMAKKGRIIDLSGAAAKKLGFLKKGVTRVEVEQVDKPVRKLAKS